MQKLITIALLLVSFQLSAQAKLTLIFKKETSVYDINDVNKIAKTPEILYYLNVTNEASEYFLVTEGNVDGTAMNIPSNFLYKNMKTNTFTQQIENSGEFTHGTLPELSWTLKSDSKKILGYQVKKAVLEISPDHQIIAWYSNLKYTNGPEKYQGLPGLILEIEDNHTQNGKKETTTLSAISVELSKNGKQIFNPGISQ